MIHVRKSMHLINKSYKLLNQLILQDQKFEYPIVNKTIKYIYKLYDCIEYLVYIQNIQLLEGIKGLC